MTELGSSDAPVVLGVSPFRTRWNLWATLTGLLPEDDYESEIMSMGTALQDTVLREFCLRERWVIEKDQPTYHHKSKPYLRATPDGLILQYRKGEDAQTVALAEIKCVIGHVPDVPRVDWLIQCQHQRFVAESVEPEISEQYLVAFGGLQMRWWEVPRHQGAIDRILREEDKFLEMVEKETPPPVSARDASALNRAWPWAKAKAVDLSDELLDHDRIIEDCEAGIATLTKLRDESEAQIKAAMQDATKGTMSNGSSYDWTAYTRRGYTVKEARIRRFTRHGRKNDEG